MDIKAHIKTLKTYVAALESGSEKPDKLASYMAENNLTEEDALVMAKEHIVNFEAVLEGVK